MCVLCSILEKMFEPQYIISADPLAIAVIENGQEWTYGAFISHVRHYTSYLKNHGIARLFLDLPQGFHGYALIWASYFSGTTICPIPPEIPFNRKEIILDQFLPDLIITNDAELLRRNNAVDVKSIELCGQPSPIDLLQIPRFSNIVYVIFTSGSTGIPKGVVVNRNSLQNFLNWSCTEYKLKKGDRWAQYSSLGFDLSICDIFTCLSQEATLVSFTTKSQKLFPAKFIKQLDISFWHSVPGVIDLMYQSGQLTESNLHNVRVMSFCGGKLYPHHLEWLFQANPELIIYNNYGPTESTIYCTTQKLTKDNYLKHCSDTVSIGSTIPGYEIYLEADKHADLEVIIISNFISDGYLSTDDSDLFKSREQNGLAARSYRTGDFVKQINGDTYFLKRKDAQIKVNGHRIDLSEIDYWIRIWQPTIPCTTTFQNGRILSFIQTTERIEDKLLDFLKKKLPFHYLPYRIVCIDKFSYNVNHKVDIEALYAIFINKILQADE